VLIHRLVHCLRQFCAGGRTSAPADWWRVFGGFVSVRGRRVDLSKQRWRQRRGQAPFLDAQPVL